MSTRGTNAIRRWQSSRTLTSVTTGIAWTPSARHSSATASSLSRRRAARTTFAPRRANSGAAARPMPLDAPVITTVLPCNFVIVSWQVYSIDSANQRHLYSGSRLRRPHAFRRSQEDLDERQAPQLRGREDPRLHARAALRFRALRRHSLLRHERQRAVHLPARPPHPPPLRLLQDLSR